MRVEGLPITLAVMKSRAAFGGILGQSLFQSGHILGNAPAPAEGGEKAQFLPKPGHGPPLFGGKGEAAGQKGEVGLGHGPGVQMKAAKSATDGLHGVGGGVALLLCPGKLGLQAGEGCLIINSSSL